MLRNLIQKKRKKNRFYLRVYSPASFIYFIYLIRNIKFIFDSEKKEEEQILF